MRPLIFISVFLSFLALSSFQSTALSGELNSAKTAAEVVEDFHDEAEDSAGEFVSGALDRMKSLKEKALKEIDGINLSQKPGEARYNNLRDAVTGYMDGVISILEGASGDKDELKAASRRLKASKAQGLSRLEEVHKQEVLKGAEGPPVPSVDRPRYEDKEGAPDIWYR